jgi:ferric-dicitrate binding protein FerR (iron transport regulator)
MSNKEEILAKWLEGSLSKDEQAELAKHYDLESLSDMLSLVGKMETETVDTDEGWNDFEKLQKKDSHFNEESHHHDPHHHHGDQKNSGYIPLITLVGLVLIGLFLAYYFLSQEKTTIRTTDGEAEFYALEDGSSIDIGQGSTIEYNKADWNRERLLKLDGQAIFDVEKGVPFIVETKAGIITVLGTKFDVWCIDEDWLRVQCLEGRVSVNTGNKNIIVTVGKEVSLLGGKVEESIIIPGKELDWKDNYRTYRNTDLAIVLADLSRFYKETFILKGEEDKEVFSGTIPTDNLEKAKEYIELSTGYEYRNSTDTIYFSPIK